MGKRKKKQIAVLAIVTSVFLVTGFLMSSDGNVIETIYHPYKTVKKNGDLGVTIGTKTDTTPNRNLVYELEAAFERAGIELLLTGVNPREEWNVLRSTSNRAESIELVFEVTASQKELLDHYRAQIGPENSLEKLPYRRDAIAAYWSSDGCNFVIGVSPSTFNKGMQRVQISMNGPNPFREGHWKMP
ncbi:MAG: hypothetical protein IIC73_04585 [Armatimonadetes bacterium]|nr:hypothetical protein [Armatimonadota bacterium]